MVVVGVVLGGGGISTTVVSTHGEVLQYFEGFVRVKVVCRSDYTAQSGILAARKEFCHHDLIMEISRWTSPQQKSPQLGVHWNYDVIIYIFTLICVIGENRDDASGSLPGEWSC